MSMTTCKKLFAVSLFFFTPMVFASDCQITNLRHEIATVERNDFRGVVNSFSARDLNGKPLHYDVLGHGYSEGPMEHLESSNPKCGSFFNHLIDYIDRCHENKTELLQTLSSILADPEMPYRQPCLWIENHLYRDYEFTWSMHAQFLEKLLNDLGYDFFDNSLPVNSEQRKLLHKITLSIIDYIPGSIRLGHTVSIERAYFTLTRFLHIPIGVLLSRLNFKDAAILYSNHPDFDPNLTDLDTTWHGFHERFHETKEWYNDPTHEGYSILMEAAWRGQVALVRQLLRNPRTSLTLRHGDGGLAQDFAWRQGFLGIHQMIKAESERRL